MTFDALKKKNSPHIHADSSSSAIMWSVVIALLPASAWGVWIFGLPALWVLLVSVLAAVGTEYVLGLIAGERTVLDGSACVTGLLIGMNMPSSVPLYVPVIASIFAIAVVKWLFGGLGANWMNPALGGRAFVFFSFTSAMSSFPVPRVLAQAQGTAAAVQAVSTSAVASAGTSAVPAVASASIAASASTVAAPAVTSASVVATASTVASASTVAAASTLASAGTAATVDVVATATPLALVKTAIASGADAGQGLAGLMASQGYPATQSAQGISDFFGGHISPYAVDAFFGNMGGSIGEISVLLLLAGGIFLLVKKIISWHIPVAYLGSFALLAWCFGGLRSGLPLFHGDVLLPLLTGGLVLGALFMATDMVSTPVTNPGRLVFGIGCGLLTFLLRYYGPLPEATSLAILLMNILTPTIDKYIRPRLYGTGRPARIQHKEVKA